MGSLFSGSGGFELAASLCGIEPVWASEIEPYPISVTRSRFPEMKHLGDVSKVSGADIEPVDIVTFGSPCFPAGTLVLTNKGYRPIEELRCGDIVFTHKGNWKPISAIGCKKSHTVKLKGNHYGIITTPNHPFYSAEQGKQWNGNGYTRTLEKIGGWTAAAEMQGKRWAVPNSIHGIAIPHIAKTSAKQNTPPAIDQDLMYIIGRWLGDGWLRNGQRQNRPEGETWGQIFICANADKAGYLEERLHIVFDGVSAINRFSDRTEEKFRVCNQPLCEWIAENFGSYAYGKRIPAWAYCMNTKMREALLHGYIDSDGWRYKKNTWKATTVSKELAHGIRLLAETLDYSCTVHYADVGSTTVIEGRTVNQKPQYQVVMCKEKRTTAIKHGMHTWYKCRTVESYSENQTVYNITVKDDHSYIVEGFVVHNCQDMSIAGKRAGLKHADNGDDETTRSGLFIEAIRIIKEMREATNGRYPRFVLWENVLGAFNSNKGEDFRIVLGEFVKISEPHAVMPSVPNGGWPNADHYCGNGWSLAYRVFDAQYWGVPQRRRRIYLVVDFAGRLAGDILFKRDGLSGYSAEGRETRERTAGGAAGSTGADDCAKRFDARGNGDGKKCSTITGDHESRITDYTNVVIANTIPIHDKATRFRGGGQTRNGDGAGNGLGVGVAGAPAPTISTGDRHAVCYSMQKVGEYKISESAATLAARDHKSGSSVVAYPSAVRRLTPTECARLQGFPDWWANIGDKPDFTDDEYRFWRDVRNTYAAVNGKSVREYTKPQMLSWYNNLHTDSAEYKMWGNGMAFPCVLYVMEGVKEEIQSE